jgi:hypothetical protein
MHSSVLTFVQCDSEQDRPCTYKVTIRPVRVTIVVQKYYIFWVCVCSCRYPAFKAHAPYCIVVCGLSGCTIFFPNCLINGMIFGRKVMNTKCVFWFRLQLLSETFLILRSVQRDTFKNVYWSSCEVPVILVKILMQLEFPKQIFEKASNIKFHESAFSGSRAVHCEWADRDGEDGRTDTWWR